MAITQSERRALELRLKAEIEGSGCAIDSDSEDEDQPEAKMRTCARSQGPQQEPQAKAEQVNSCAIESESKDEQQPEKSVENYNIKIISEANHHSEEAVGSCANKSDSDCDEPFTIPQKCYQRLVMPTKPQSNPPRVGSNVSLLSVMLSSEASSKGHSPPSPRKTRTIRFAGEAQQSTNKSQWTTDKPQQVPNIPITPSKQAHLPPRRAPTAPSAATAATVPLGDLRRSSSHPAFSAHPGIIPMSEDAEARRLRSRELGAQLCHALYNERQVNIWPAGIRTCERIDEKEDNRRLSWDLAMTGSWANGW